MIIHRVYFRKKNDAYGERVKCMHEGWFLLGIIPLYCRQMEWPKNPE